MSRSAPATTCRPRRGISLVEMLVVIAIGSVVMGAVVSGAATLLSVNGRVKNRADAAEQVDLLVRRLRADLHAADQAQFDDEATELVLTSPQEEEVRYRFEPGGGVRESSEGALPFRLPAGATVACDAGQTSAPAVYQLSITLDATHSLPIAARLGSARRLLAPGGSP
ncbi:hypothetical protein Pla123a_33320 [Posidoniimonas polymericola]|uniref:Uncharacterized protein n=1 Tax=Posidoniimonas polymericola TaxID=2528002 RepID=A0A5C5YH87_9BACT|nr:prepilin-type N-terminal cleavage/methylation domain-containing protein [Posidoniimonas polymericola]TWT74509.1 hypothetical protein Pla123a_33320 [Posidoniimonas polymericola]